VGFAGVVIVVRPGATTFEWALLIPVAAAFSNALRDLMTRRLARTETSISILFWSALIVTVASAATAITGWRPISPSAAAWFVAAGLLNTGAHFLLIEAFRMAEAAVVAPMRYTSLIWGTIFGYLVWKELPDVWVLLGAAVIVASGVYMIRSESRPRAKIETRLPINHR